MKVVFLKWAGTRAKLGYMPGEEGELDDALAKQLVEEGYVKPAEEASRKAKPARSAKTAATGGKKGSRKKPSS
jgi:hypothetical protein